MSKWEQEDALRAWEPRIQEFRASGLSGPQWCAQTGFTIGQLRYWTQKVRAAAPETSGATWIAMAPPESPSSGLIVRMGTLEILVEPGFNPAFLQSVVRTLASC